jgi:hypothetical protein
VRRDLEFVWLDRVEEAVAAALETKVVSPASAPGDAPAEVLA